MPLMLLSAASHTDLKVCFSDISQQQNHQAEIKWVTVSSGTYACLLVVITQGLCTAKLLLLFSCPVMSDSLWPHRLQYTRPPCPSPSLRVCLSSCPLHQWCHPAISSSDAVLSFCPQSFPASGTFPMSWLFASGDQNTGASDSASVLPMSIQHSFPLRLIRLISLLTKEGLLLQHHEGISSLVLCLLHSPALTTTCDHWEYHSLYYMDLCWQSNISAF